MPRHGRDNDGEGVGGITAELRGARQQRDQLVKFMEGPGPAMRQQYRLRRGSLAMLVNEVQVDTIDRSLELPEAVEKRFLLAPIVTVAPVADEALQVSQVGPQGPGRAGHLVRPSHVTQAVPKILQLGLRDRNLERARRPAIPAARSPIVQSVHARFASNGPVSTLTLRHLHV